MTWQVNLQPFPSQEWQLTAKLITHKELYVDSSEAITCSIGLLWWHNSISNLKKSLKIKRCQYSKIKTHKLYLCRNPVIIKYIRLLKCFDRAREIIYLLHSDAIHSLSQNSWTGACTGIVPRWCIILHCLPEYALNCGKELNWFGQKPWPNFDRCS